MKSLSVSALDGEMTTEGIPTQRRMMSSVIRDVCRLYRSVTKIWARDKQKKANDSGKAAFQPHQKLKCKTKKYKSLPKPGAIHDDPTPQDTIDKTGKERVKQIRVQSFREAQTIDKSSGERTTLSPLARSWSRSSTPTKGSSLGRSMSTNRAEYLHPHLSSRNLSRSSSFKGGSCNTTPILFSSSSCHNLKPPPTERELECTLEELCTGCTKKIKITRDVFTDAGQVTEEEALKIKVRPGWKNGTTVTFEGKGNEPRGTLPADLVFVIVEKEHDVFRREGDDLETEVEINLVEALTGSNLSISLPDGETLSLSTDDIIHPNYVKVIEGKGMPDPKEKDKRGDLRVRFRIKFPTELTKQQQQEIRSILEDST